MATIHIRISELAHKAIRYMYSGGRCSPDTETQPEQHNQNTARMSLN